MSTVFFKAMKSGDILFSNISQWTNSWTGVVTIWHGQVFTIQKHLTALTLYWLNFWETTEVWFVYAWVELCWVELQYRPLKSPSPSEFRFEIIRSNSEREGKYQPVYEPVTKSSHIFAAVPVVEHPANIASVFTIPANIALDVPSIEVPVQPHSAPVLWSLGAHTNPLPTIVSR